MDKEIQVGWEITTTLQSVKDLNLTTNAGATSIEPVGQDQVKLSTLDLNQFNKWHSKLTEAGYKFSASKPIY